MLKVRIQHSDRDLSTAIWIFEIRDSGRWVYQFDGNGHWSTTNVALSDTSKPTLIIPGVISNEVLKALAEAIHNQGIRPDANSIAEGELKATKLHLSDMRQLVFSEKEPK